MECRRDICISFIILLIFSVLFCCCADDEPMPVPYYNEETHGHMNIYYGRASTQNLDIYVADDSLLEREHPVAIYIHGGGWSSGDKSEWSTNAVNAFRDLDYISVSVNYRLSGEVAFPVNLEDVVSAINWIYNHIQEYGGNPHDLNLIGHSSGAHLAALVACNQKYMEWADFDCHDLHSACMIDGGGYLAMQDAIYEDEDILALTKKSLHGNMDYWSDFGPANSVSECEYLPHIILCHSDNEYRVKSNQEFIQALQEAGFEYSEYEMPGYSHGGMLSFFPQYDGIQDLMAEYKR